MIRTAPWVIVLTGVAALASAGAAAVLLGRQGTSPGNLVLALLAALLTVASLDAAVTRLEMEGDALHVVSLFRRRKYVRSGVVKAARACGSGVGLRLSDGSWVRLPELGRSSRGLAHSLRAWLQAHDDDARASVRR
ncbi:MAG TPA: hypothetical protein VMR21_07680 [Vicinamibacteria bacterium]|nr:hypothetical protein [Vicinamibacteria bacterium]